MNVITPPFADGVDPKPVCIVADDIFETMTARRKIHFSIYVIFKKNVELAEPFKLLYYTEKKNVAHLDGSVAQDFGLPMWTKDDGQRAPDLSRQKNDYIKLDFFTNINNPEDGFSYCWTDCISTKNTTMVPRQLMPPSKRSMKLYLILPVEESNIMVLSEKAYGSLQLMKKHRKMGQPPQRVGCYINFNCQTSKVMFGCGHVYCEQCLNSWNDKPCSVCLKPVTSEPTQLKLRQGPCPFDLCSPNSSTMGIVLIPCGCHVMCQNLEDAYERNKHHLEPLIEKIKYCPFEPCRIRVRKLKKPFWHQQDKEHTLEMNSA